MAYVISRLCRDCVDTSCVEQCPVDCIVEHRPSNHASELPNQLFIDPEECINCGPCAPECPWEAIYEYEELPPEFAEDAEPGTSAGSSRPCRRHPTRSSQV
jgi:ferredoxin